MRAFLRITAALASSLSLSVAFSAPPAEAGHFLFRSGSVAGGIHDLPTQLRIAHVGSSFPQIPNLHGNWISNFARSANVNAGRPTLGAIANAQFGEGSVVGAYGLCGLHLTIRDQSGWAVTRQSIC